MWRGAHFAGSAALLIPLALTNVRSLRLQQKMLCHATPGNICEQSVRYPPTQVQQSIQFLLAAVCMCTVHFFYQFDEV